MSQFITGLKNEIKAELRLHGPPNLETAMELAFKVEEKLKQTQPRNPYPRTSHHPSLITHKSYSNPNSQPTKNPNYNPTISRTNHGGLRRLSDREYRHWRDRGLCYRCDEKWSV